MNAEIKVRDEGDTIAKVVLTPRTIAVVLSLCASMLAWSAVQIFHTGRSYEHQDNAIVELTQTVARTADNLQQISKVIEDRGRVIAALQERQTALEGRVAVHDDSLRTLSITVTSIGQALNSVTTYMQDVWVASQRRAARSFPLPPPAEHK